MRLSEIKGEDGLDMLADILEPAAEIMTDAKVKQLAQNDERIKLISHILKEHKKSILTIMAIVNREDPATYNPSIIELPKLALELFSRRLRWGHRHILGLLW